MILCISWLSWFGSQFPLFDIDINILPAKFIGGGWQIETHSRCILCVPSTLILHPSQYRSVNFAEDLSFNLIKASINRGLNVKVCSSISCEWPPHWSLCKTWWSYRILFLGFQRHQIKIRQCCICTVGPVRYTLTVVIKPSRLHMKRSNFGDCKEAWV